MKFCHRRIARFQHLHEQLRRKQLEVRGLDAIGERIHGLPPRPKSCRERTTGIPCCLPCPAGTHDCAHSPCRERRTPHVLLVPVRRRIRRPGAPSRCGRMRAVVCRPRRARSRCLAALRAACPWANSDSDRLHDTINCLYLYRQVSLPYHGMKGTTRVSANQASRHRPGSTGTRVWIGMSIATMVAGSIPYGKLETRRARDKGRAHCLDWPRRRRAPPGRTRMVPIEHARGPVDDARA